MSRPSGEEGRSYDRAMTTQRVRRDETDLGELFDRSPAVPAHTAGAAALSLVLGLGAILTAPFSLTYGLCVILAALCVVSSVVGLAQASRAGVAGGSLAAAGLVLSLAAGALVGLRFAGVDTTVDSVLPALRDALRALNDLVPQP